MIAYTGKPECDIRDVLIAELTRQRDELLAALEHVLDGALSLPSFAEKQARDAIASVKVGA